MIIFDKALKTVKEKQVKDDHTVSVVLPLGQDSGRGRGQGELPESWTREVPDQSLAFFLSFGSIKSSRYAYTFHQFL